MSTLPPPFDPSDDDADEQYRRASERDPSRPSEATRRAVLAYAARLAAERGRRDARRRWLSLIGAPLRMRPAIVGTIATAVLAGIVIAPQFLAPAGLPESQLSPVTTPPQAAGAPAVAPVTAPIAEAPQAAPAAQLAAQKRTPPHATSESAGGAAPPVPRLQARRTPQPSEMALQQSFAAKAAPGGTLQRQADTALSSFTAASAPVRAPVPAAPPASGGAEALRQAAAAGDLEALRAQLARGTDIDARDAQGRTALMLATLNGRSNAVAALLADGADPSAADARGTTPLQAAVAADERGIVAMLRRYGAR